MWHFRKMSRSEINTDPTEGDFFNVDALSNLADALVRESIQNSLDAGSDNPDLPVTVKIRISTVDEALSAEVANQFLNGLRPHIDASDIVTDPPAVGDSVSWIAVEDFDTRGLVGDEHASEDPVEGRNDFFYFWRNVGRGKKEGSDRGRWGLGKTMFPASSRIHSFFGMTVRAEDRKPLLMGQSVLQIHHLDGNKHYPYGYYGIEDPADGFVTPIEDEDIILDFVDMFKLSRINEPGLSIVIPYPRNSIGKEEIICSLIHHYFFPIQSGDLIVEIDCGSDHVRLTNENLMEYTEEVLDDDEYAFKGMLGLTDSFLQMTESEILHAKDQPPRAAPKWEEELFSGNELEEMTTYLDEGKVVAIKIPVHIAPKGKEIRASHFHLVLQRDPDLEIPKDIFVRQGITISGVTSLRDSGVRALVIAQDDALATFLGDSENPAHTEWQERSRKFKGKYNRGPSTLKFVKDAPRSIMRLLNRHAEYVDDTALRHIFPQKVPEGPSHRNRSPVRSQNPTRVRVPNPNPNTRTRKIQVNGTAEGFSVILTEDGKNILPLSMKIKCAYDSGKGNPFKKWSPADFDFNSHKDVEIEGGSISQKEKNVFELTVNDADFRFQVSGFDPNRDLITDVRVVKDNA